VQAPVCDLRFQISIDAASLDGGASTATAGYVGWYRPLHGGRRLHTGRWLVVGSLRM